MAARAFSPAIGGAMLVGLGGAVGTLARYLLSESAGAAGDDPIRAFWVTSGINVGGALLLGIVVAVCAARYPRVQLLLGTGVLGGFTTYSLLAADVARLGLVGIGMGLVTVAVGFVGVMLGSNIGTAIRANRDARTQGHRTADLSGGAE